MSGSVWWLLATTLAGLAILVRSRPGSLTECVGASLALAGVLAVPVWAALGMA